MVKHKTTQRLIVVHEPLEALGTLVHVQVDHLVVDGHLALFGPQRILLSGLNYLQRAFFAHAHD